MAERVYLDWNATAPLRPAARDAMIAALDQLGNPSSVHAEGRAARRLIDEARERVAGLVGAKPANVIFTSGGTEANRLALTPPPVRSDGPTRAMTLLVSDLDHASVRSGGRFPREAIGTVATLAEGTLDLADFERQVASNARQGPVLAAAMLVNNETGIIQPVREAADLVHASGGLLHVDAVQAAGRIPIVITELGADLLAISGHKIGGPQGVGALVRRDDAVNFPYPDTSGGRQERGMRAGTENVAGIVGFGVAAGEVGAELGAEPPRILALRDRLEQGLRAISPDVVIFGEGAKRVQNTTLFAVPGLKAETVLIALDLDGIAVSSGAACSSGKVAPSAVLAAMGVPTELSRGAVRVSLGFSTAESDIERFLDAWMRLSKTLLKRAEGIAA